MAAAGAEVTDDRLRALEIQVTALRGDLNGHVALCDGRWRVAWRLAGGISAAVAAAVSLAIAMLRP
jgi:hypothetical protein